MKTLVVYYSLEGNTKEAAEKIASSIGSDIMELVPVKDIPKKGLMKFIHGGSGATMGKGTELQPYTKDASSYDAIIVFLPRKRSSVHLLLPADLRTSAFRSFAKSTRPSSTR